MSVSVLKIPTGKLVSLFSDRGLKKDMLRVIERVCVYKRHYCVRLYYFCCSRIEKDHPWEGIMNPRRHLCDVLLV